MELGNIIIISIAMVILALIVKISNYYDNLKLYKKGWFSIAKNKFVKSKIHHYVFGDKDWGLFCSKEVRRYAQPGKSTAHQVYEHHQEFMHIFRTDFVSGFFEARKLARKYPDKYRFHYHKYSQF